jgi:hypothetical protein
MEVGEVWSSVCCIQLFLLLDFTYTRTLEGKLADADSRQGESAGIGGGLRE